MIDYEKLATQLESNADAHQEPKGTERRRAAEAIRELHHDLLAAKDLLVKRTSAWQTAHRVTKKMLANAEERQKLFERFGVTPVWTEDKIDGSNVATITEQEAYDLLVRLASLEDKQ